MDTSALAKPTATNNDAGRGLDYPEMQMASEQDAPMNQPQTGSGSSARLTSADPNRAGAGDPASERPATAPLGDAQGGASANLQKPKNTPPLNKWQTFWRGVLHVDTAKMEPWIALRNAMGVAIPLAVGIAIGMPLGGLAVASGALNVSYSDGQDPYQQRAKRMLAASVLCAAAVMAGGLAGHHNAAAIALIAIWA